MSLRLLFAIHGPADPRTGVYLTVSRRAAYLRSRGHSVDIVTPADLPFGGWSRLQPLLLPVALASRDLARYDVVVFHSHLAWAHALARKCGRGKPATVVTFHGLEPLYHAALGTELARTGERLSRRFHLLHRVLVPRLLSLASRRADRVVCLNSQERDFLIAHRWAVPERVVVLPNGVEPDLFLQRTNYAQRAQRLLFTGQWLRAKGIRYLARAFETIASAYPEAELTCVGTGAPVEAVLADFAPGVRDRVRVLPSVDRAGLSAELARADLFVFPSLSEGFSGALLEGMAAALPVVATPVGGAPDILRHEESAVIVPVADSAAIAEAVAALVDDALRRRRLGTSAQAAARPFEWDAVNERFANEIEQVARATA